MLITLGASLLGDLLTGRGIYRAGKGKRKGVLRDGYGSKWIFNTAPPFN